MSTKTTLVFITSIDNCLCLVNDIVEGLLWNTRYNGQNYIYIIVNHSLNFVDPDRGANMQSIETIWSQCKRMMGRESNL